MTLTLTIRGLTEAANVGFSVVEGEGALARSEFEVTPGRSNERCDAVGKELVCGNTFTPSKQGTVRIEASVGGRKASMRVTVGGAAEQSPRCPSQVLEAGKRYSVTLETSKGAITVRLLTDSAPKTANSFACLARSGFFNNQTFYRVDPGFVIVSGDPTKSGDGDAGYGTPLEASTVRNTRGTLSVGARPSGTVGSQFFINLVDNKHLDFDNGRPDHYYPFAVITSGQDVVDSIAAGSAGTVTILRATLAQD